MKNLFHRQFDMLLRVSSFDVRNPQLFPPESLPGQMFAIIAATLPELSKSAALQATGFALNRGGSTSKADARAVLFDCLDAISLTARAMGRVDASIRAKFQMPYSANDRDAISVARQFAEHAQERKDEFIAHQMDPGFLDELNAAIARFEVSIVEYNDAKGTQTNATATIEEVIQKAMEAAYRLDGMVPNKIRNNRPLVKEWESARRVARPRGPSKPDPESPSALPLVPAAAVPAAAGTAPA